MKLFLRICVFGIVLTLLSPVHPVRGESEPSSQSPATILFRDRFFLSPEVRLSQELQEVSGFNLLPQPSKDWDSNFAILTGFADRILRGQALKGIKTVQEAQAYFEQYERQHLHLGAIIRELPVVRGDGTLAHFFWVGDQSFPSLEGAQKAVSEAKNEIEELGGNFDEAVRISKETRPIPPVSPKEEGEKYVDQEEDFAMEVMKFLGLDRHYLGRLGGIRAGEPVLYQSTFESTFRFHNLDQRHYDSAVGFYSHRIVVQGLKFIGETTIDPYIDAIPVGETNGKDFATYLELGVGLEWRPFIQSAFLQNFQPYGIPLLDWIRNYRAYVAWLERKPLKEPFSDADQTFDLEAGVTIFKEWGVDLPSITAEKPSFPQSLFQDFLWGEYFGEYVFRRTNFSSTDDYDAFSSTTAFRVGIKFPKIPLPENPVNDEFVFMPYFILEDIRSSSQGAFADNKWFWGFGVRWMPFRSYRFSNSEWLFKMKLFFEYIGGIHYRKQKPVSEVPETDYRLGVNLSLRRF